jgi:hypothetical protein
MFAISHRLALPTAAIAVLGLSSCSGPATVRVGTPDFYWSAARETYASGDFRKTADHLDHLIETQNEYTNRAIPWSLVLTSGMAAGYMDIADYYAAGARINKANSLEFRRKASEFRSMASPLALRFAQNIEKLDQITGSITLAFSLPNGNAALPPQLAQVSRGIELNPSDLANVQWLAIQHGVLLTACLAAGAPNDVAKTSEILGHSSAITSRAVFGRAMATMLERGASLYSREKLDDSNKMAILRQRARTLLDTTQQSALVVQTRGSAQ